jgi:hypothetical protein
MQTFEKELNEWQKEWDEAEKAYEKKVNEEIE